MSFLDEFNDKLDKAGEQGMSEKQVKWEKQSIYKVSADLFSKITLILTEWSDRMVSCGGTTCFT